MIHWAPVVEGDEETGPADLPPFAQPQHRTVAGSLWELPLLIGLAVLIAFIFKAFVAQAFFIPSGSMIPELEKGDRVVVSKLAYRLHTPRRGDIVVFDCPPRADCPPDTGKGALPVRMVRGLFEAVGLRQPSTQEYIKRIIGLPGETVEGHDGKVFVNGREVVEPYLPPGTTTTSFPPIVVGKGELWVMGDNRSQSLDSRYFGTIKRSKVVGRAVVRAWPGNRIGFM